MNVGDVRPNEMFRAARLARPSTTLPGEPTSMAELAEAVNDYLWRLTGRRYALDAHAIARYERGAVRWPNAAYRTALRAILDKRTDVELGFRATPRGRARMAEQTEPATAVAPAIDGRAPTEHAAQLRELYAVDQARGAHHALSGVVTLLDVITGDLRDREGADRLLLLRVGSRAAEFAGFLTRDLGDAARCRTWHDQAMEWSQQADDVPMQAYVLLRKAQTAYDDRDPLRMLDLTSAADRHRSALDSGLVAEIIQQRARGEAMLGATESDVRRRLDQARTALDSAVAPGDSDTPGQDYSSRRLELQTAICLAESGRPAAAVDAYRPLVATENCERNCAYFSMLMAIALACSGEPDEAATVACAALPIAARTKSRRTLREGQRLTAVLGPWRRRRAVREFEEAHRVATASPPA